MATIAGLKSHDSILSKLDTFKRKKKARQELEDLAKESKQAIENAVNLITIEDPKEYQLDEGEERSFIEKSSQNSPVIQCLIEKLISWINNELVDQRIFVRDIQEDMYDGQLLQKLVEKLTEIKFHHPELTQSEIGQLQRLKSVLRTINEILPISESWANQCWTPERIYHKDLIAILRLLVAMARQFKPEMHFQQGIFLTLIIARKLNGVLEYRYEREYITEPNDSTTDGNPLDLLSGHQMVLEAVMNFVNAYLGQLGFKIQDISNDFNDGVMLILLIGLIEGYFVPFYHYYPTPTTEAMRLANVSLAFELIQSAGITEAPARPDEIVAGDANAILRVLYGIYSHVSQQFNLNSELNAQERQFETPNANQAGI